MANKERQLSLKQRLFCDWYLKLMNITRAAIKAGYSKKTAYAIGSENLKKLEIQKYLTQRRSKHEELLGFNKTTLLTDLLEIKDRCKQAEPVMRYNPVTREMEQETAMQKNEKTGELEEIGIYQFDSRGANRAVEIIAKMMGYNEPEKVEDVTPKERKAQPVTIIKNYAQPANKSPHKADASVGSSGDRAGS